MKVAGVIAEYNPFHNGHKYQLEQIKKGTNADYIIAAISGDFVQRGDPAIINKYARAKMALSCGADLVLEMPVTGSCASAEFFAKSGVNLLASTGIVKTLCYGVETIPPANISEIAKFLRNTPDLYKKQINKFSKDGLSFPAARAKALSSLAEQDGNTAISADFISSQDNTTAGFADFIATPNNILALEYEKALLDTDMESLAILRTGEAYHNNEISSEMSSASAIRNAMLSEIPSASASATLNVTLDETTNNFSSIAHTMPDECISILRNYYKTHTLCSPDNFSDILYYKLLSQKDYGFCDYADCSKELSAKICKNIYAFENFSQFIMLLKSKNLTYTRISRVLLHILLNIKKEDITNIASKSSNYLRILGLKKEATPLLHEIKKRASAPLITKVADAPYELLKKDIYAADLYERIATRNHASRKNISNEYTHGVIIVP